MRCLHARLAQELSLLTQSRGLMRRHLNPLLETGYSRPILFEDLPPLAAQDRADSVQQVARVRALPARRLRERAALPFRCILILETDAITLIKT